MPTVVPVIDESRGFRFWHKKEIYIGPTGPTEARFVPNVDDAVWDWDTGLYRVVAVNATLSTLEPWSFTDMNGGVIPEDIILSTGPNRVSESYRVYIDTSVTPHRCAFDSRLYINSQEADHVKLFLGTDIGPSGHVISGVFNVSNVLISEDIPLQLVVMPTMVNVGIKTPVVASVIEPVADGSLVTAVVYSATGVKLSAFHLITKLTNFIHTVDTSKRYIVDIELLSPYLSTTDTHLLEYPVNMTLQSGTLQGRITYNDATTLDLPIDGSRFSLLGMDRFVANTAGNSADLVLLYNLQPNEYALGLNVIGAQRFKTKEYRVTAISSNGAYSVKLFVAPYWNVGTGRWALNYYLYDLDRDTHLLVTPFVETVINTLPFDGTVMNAWQFMNVAINLNDADNSYLNYRYPQSFAIQLRNAGSNATADEYFLLEYQTGITFGSGIKAIVSPDVNLGQKRLDISQNLTNTNDWVNRVYYPLKPLILSSVETVPPVPTFVRIEIGSSWTRDIPIAQITQQITGITTPVLNGTPITLRFIKQEATELQLAVVSINARE